MTARSSVCKYMIINGILVEAAGVEPASENVTGQETTCLFRVHAPVIRVLPPLPGTFAATASNGQETASTPQPEISNLPAQT